MTFVSSQTSSLHLSYERQTVSTETLIIFHQVSTSSCFQFLFLQFLIPGIRYDVSRLLRRPAARP